MILVAGSTGLLGSEICRQLTTQQRQVRALVRKTSTPEKIAALRELGCDITEGDLKDIASLKEACKGCDVVISTVTTTLSRQEGDNIQTVDHDGHLNLVAAAKEAGVRHFIFISFRHQYAPETALTAAKRSTEQAIVASGMNYTILQASIFMEIWLSPALGFNYLENTAQIPGNGTNAISYVSYRDVAAFAVGSVSNPAVVDKVLEIGGPSPLSPAQVVEVFEKTSGKSFAVQYIPVAALQKQMEEPTDPWQKIFSGIMIMYANGDVIEMNETLEKIPVTLTSVKDYANAVLRKESAGAV
jgi:uncharacterized protein YbjT (DUF2867 family)